VPGVAPIACEVGKFVIGWFFGLLGVTPNQAMRSLKLTETVDRLSGQGDAQSTETPWLSASQTTLGNMPSCSRAHLLSLRLALGLNNRSLTLTDDRSLAGATGDAQNETHRADQG
jgi:hypothetical protein